MTGKKGRPPGSEAVEESDFGFRRNDGRSFPARVGRGYALT